MPADAGARMVTLAVIIGAHGIGGEVRLKLFTEDLSAYPAFDLGGQDVTLRALRQTPNGAIARIDGVADRTAAEALRGRELRVARAALPPLEAGEYYHADLIGLVCRSTGGEEIGHVVTVENFGAGDVLEIERADGRTFMVPMRAEAVPEWTGDHLTVDQAFVEP